MSEVVHADVVEQILIRSDMEDLIRCRSVCKSWNSLITSPGFINRHLDRNYYNDRHNNEFRHRRVVLSRLSSYRLVGSSNGLVCFISDFDRKVLVGNPWTMELRQLRSLPVSSLLSCGFGYDSSRDDYKLVVMASKGKKGKKGKNRTRVQVLSLESNAWRVIEEVKYEFCGDEGILCDGALYWIVDNENKKMVIISYDLSEDEFKEIHLPEDARYEKDLPMLGIMNECLCIWDENHEDIWLMKKHNGKQSWELTKCDHDREHINIVHTLNIPADESCLYDFGTILSGNPVEPVRCALDAPIYVQSLVPTHKSSRAG